MKFRVHSFQVVRVTYEVEANSTIEAKGMVDKDGCNMEAVEVGPVPSEEWTEDLIVDPLLPNGEVDYDNVTNFGPLAGPKQNTNFIHIRGWKVQASPDGTYLYVQRVGKAGDIHVKAEDEGFVIDVWNDDRKMPEVMATLCCEYNDLLVGEPE